MVLGHLKVVRVVRWRNFHRASTVVHIDVLVGDNRDFLVGDWQENPCADKVLVALIVRVDSYCYVAQHGLRPRGGDDNFADFIQRRVSDLPQLPCFIFMFNLDVGEAGLVFGTIINNPLAAVN